MIVLTIAAPVAPAGANDPSVTAASPQTYRVTLRGSYPPRALRYVVLQDGRQVGYGVPSADETSLMVTSTDPALGTGEMTVRYEDGGPAQVPRTAFAPASTGTARSRGDRTAYGPLPVARAVYDLGEEAWQPPGLGGKVELTADVHYPAGLPGGPYPLVVFLHGNHSSCYRGTRAGYMWPCKGSWKPLPNYEGYDYLAKKLASFGYIAVSISGNGVNVLGNQVDDTGMQQRGALILHHLDLWDVWNTTGAEPFGTMFAGKVDMSRIGVMGHSRGGEGAVYSALEDQDRPVPYGIDAVFALAPVDFTRPAINDAALGVLLPYCDGDVSDLEGVHFFDDSRYASPGDVSPKVTVTALGANHNFFNTVWTPGGPYPGGFDDGTWTKCADPLPPVKERKLGRGTMISFFRRYVGGETALDPMWTGADPLPIGIAKARLTYLPGDTVAQRLDLDRFTSTSALGSGENGVLVSANYVGEYRWCPDDEYFPCVVSSPWLSVHLSSTWFGPQAVGLPQGVIGWRGSSGSLRFDLPAPTDVSAYDAFQVRAATNPGYEQNRRIDYQDFSVVLLDGNAESSPVAASDVGNDALANAGEERGARHFILNQVRFPLAAFTGVDLTDIRHVEIRFDRTPRGAIDLSDVAFTAGNP